MKQSDTGSGNSGKGDSTVSDTVVLVLYGTGIHQHSSPGAVSVMWGGVPGQVEYAGPAPGFVRPKLKQPSLGQ